MSDLIKEKWLKFLSNKADEKEIIEVLDYIRDDGSGLDIEELNETWKQLNKYPSLREEHANSIFAKIATHTHHQVPGAKQVLWTGFLRIAASIAFIAVTGLAIYLATQTDPPLKEVATQAERKKVRLPDGSEVILNVNSKLQYAESFSKNKRELFLWGEAFFSVKRDVSRPFIVHSDELTVEVLGTSFNIDTDHEGSYEVAVATGKVRVGDEQGAHEVCTLVPGKKLSYAAPREFSISDIETSDVAVWRDSVMHFDNESIDKVFEAIGKRYGVHFEITNEAIRNCRLSMKVENESLETVMEDLRLISNDAITYQVTKNTVIISGKGCDKDN